MEIVYKIDGHDFKDYGVYVSASHGLIGGLKPKKRVEVEWDDCNGYQTDDTPMYFEARNISLNCFLKASGGGRMHRKIRGFCPAFLYGFGQCADGFGRREDSFVQCAPGRCDRCAENVCRGDYDGCFYPQAGRA